MKNMLINLQFSDIIKTSIGEVDFLCQNSPLVCVDKHSAFPIEHRTRAFSLEVEVIKKCIICKKKFKKPYNRSQLSWSNAKFCSCECRNIAHKGYKMPKKAKEKIRIAMFGNTHSLGKKASPEKLKKMCIAQQRNPKAFKKGQVAPMKGRKRLDIIGEKHPQWKGGISFEPYPLGWTKTHKEQIRYRDRYKCQICGVPEVEVGKKLDVHHIDYNKSNITLNNLITLCRSCHTKTNYNREYWTEVLSKSQIEI